MGNMPNRKQPQQSTDENSSKLDAGMGAWRALQQVGSWHVPFTRLGPCSLLWRSATDQR
jgi:hypothetical protein